MIAERSPRGAKLNNRSCKVEIGDGRLDLKIARNGSETELE